MFKNLATILLLLFLLARLEGAAPVFAFTPALSAPAVVLSDDDREDDDDDEDDRDDDRDDGDDDHDDGQDGGDDDRDDSRDDDQDDGGGDHGDDDQGDRDEGGGGDNGDDGARDPGDDDRDDHGGDDDDRGGDDDDRGGGEDRRDDERDDDDDDEEEKRTTKKTRPPRRDDDDDYDDDYTYYGYVQTTGDRVVVGGRSLVGEIALLDFLAPGMVIKVEGEVRGSRLLVEEIEVLNPKIWAFYEGPHPKLGWARVWFVDGQVWRVQSVNPSARVKVLACFDGHRWLGLPEALAPTVLPPRPGLWLFEGLAWQGQIQWTKQTRLGECD